MKRNIALFSLLLIIAEILSAGEKTLEINAVIKEVVVYPGNAHITSYADVVVEKGTTMLVLNNMSPFIDNQSIQVKAPDDVKILSVNHKLDYLSTSDNAGQVNQLVSMMNELQKLKENEETAIEILREKLDFLRDNRNITGNGQAITTEHLKSLTDFYANTVEKTQIEILERKRKVKGYENELTKYKNQLNALNYIEEKKNGQITIKVASSVAKNIRLIISYLVSNAGWRPSYDLRVDRVDKPLQLVYKATVFQNTGSDWNNIKLRFSNADPGKSGSAPVLVPWHLTYGSYLKSSNSSMLTPYGSYQTRNVKGVVKDENNVPLPGVSVLVKGTSIGTVTDINGMFSIDVPVNSGSLLFNYIGYIAEERYPSYSFMNLTLVPDVNQLEEVKVIGYGTQVKRSITGAVAPIDKTEKNITEKTDKVRGISSKGVIYGSLGEESTAIMQLPDIKTIVEFEISEPFTIPSGGNELSVEMKTLEIPALFEYYAIPKLDPGVFLIARISGWEKYSLLGGETNLYFENTYIGKSYLDVDKLTDTLCVSLGRDKNIIVKREKQKDFTEKQVLGNNKIETRSIEISLRNNKNQPVHINLYDQIPVSVMENIEVRRKEISGAVLNEETGELKWKLDLASDETKKFQLIYEVKYPKNQTVILE